MKRSLLGPVSERYCFFFASVVHVMKNKTNSFFFLFSLPTTPRVPRGGPRACARGHLSVSLSLSTSPPSLPAPRRRAHSQSHILRYSINPRNQHVRCRQKIQEIFIHKIYNYIDRASRPRRDAAPGRFACSACTRLGSLRKTVLGVVHA